VVAAAVLLLSRGGGAADGPDAKLIFNRRCTACHTFGKGTKVGPDLKGVTQRRSRLWLTAFIRSSQSVIGAGDAVARALFQEFKQQRMPDWKDLSEGQVAAILDWLEGNGPEQKALDERNAAVATRADVDRARDLFFGTAPLANGGLACVTCHRLQWEGSTSGGSLGPDLTAAYTKYQDGALTVFLRRPCFPRQPESSAALYLTPQESFSLKALLRQAALASADARGARPKREN